ncbi:Bis(5'-nucleosyl)-tetraphosphatase, symmetrical [Galdieria sulphuraria]|nr:Bis(5'-nucleosyl)-tetraphosphatase, symmetrical [Galdieria sulphuraria]
MFVVSSFELHWSKIFDSSRRVKVKTFVQAHKKCLFEINKYSENTERQRLPVKSVERYEASDSQKPTLVLTRRVFKKRKQKKNLSGTMKTVEEKNVPPEKTVALKQTVKASSKSKNQEAAEAKGLTSPVQYLDNQDSIEEEGYRVFFRELSQEKENLNLSTRYRGTNPPSKGLDLLYVPTSKFKLFPEAFMSQEKDWYNCARKWAILKTDFRTPIALDESRRRKLPVEAFKPKVGEEAVKNWKQLVENPSNTVSPTSRGRVLGIQAVYSEWSRFLSKNPRVIVVGDVHGCVDELRDLLKLADFRPGDQVIFLGDLVAKGPDSVAVVKIAREIGARSVRGNHDFEVIRWWNAQMNGLSGSISVNMEHLRIAQDLDREDHEWLFHCPWFIRIPEMKYLLVHAGFVPGVDLYQQNPRLMMNMRSVLPNGIITNRYVADSPWASYWKGPETVVYGHDAYRGLQQFEFAQGIDTGCVYGGRLTALLLPENRLISVRARRCYRHRYSR